MSEDFINLEKKPGGKKDITLSMIVIALIFIFVFGFVVFKEHSAREIISTASDKIAEEVEELFAPRAEREEEKEEEEEEAEEDVVEEEEETVEDIFSRPYNFDIEVEETEERKVYTKEAQRGDGLTHLARRAITEYMNEEGVTLSAEERIYVEDYVQKRLSPERGEPRFLEIGEEVEISQELIEEGVQEAENLMPAQKSNLTQYANLVSF